MKRLRLSCATLGLLLVAGTAVLAAAGAVPAVPETVRWSSSVGEVVFALAPAGPAAPLVHGLQRAREREREECRDGEETEAVKREHGN